MKKILLVCALFLTVSCTTKKEEIKNESANIKDFTKSTVKINNESTYDLKENIDVYTKDKFIPYVNVQDFVKLFNETSEYELIETKDSLNITTTYVLEDTEKSIYKGKEIREMDANFKYDKKEHTITHSGNFGDSFLEYKGEFDIDNIIKDMSITSYIESNDDFVVDLDDYDINILGDENNTYMPFYLINYYFSNNDLALYFKPTQTPVIEAFNYEKIAGGDKKETSKLKTENELDKNTQKESQKFMDLLYNEYYAFTDSKIHLDVEKHLDTLSLENQTKNKEYTNQYREFIGKLNDGHSSIVMDGYFDNNLNDDLLQSYTTSEFTAKYIQELYKNDCMTDGNDPQQTKIIDGVGYINFTSFTDDAGDYMNDQLEKVKDVNKVAIDLRCNGGGLLYTVPQVVKYMTNEDMEMFQNSGVNEQKTVFNPGSEYKKNQEFYILTSFTTYSAANYMTSLINDNNYATIIGEKSGGGGAAVRNLITPDGTIFSYADVFSIMVDKNKKEIETGIEPNIQTDAKTVEKLIEVINKN